MSAAIDEAVMAVLQGDATLQGLAPGGVFRDFAPEGVADPFVIVGLQAHEDVYEQADRPAFEQPRYLAKAVEQSTDGAGAKAAAARIHTLLHAVPLTITGFSWMDTVRESRVSYVEKDGAVYWQHQGGIYRVEADPS